MGPANQQRLMAEIYADMLNQVKVEKRKELDKSIRTALRAVQDLHAAQEITLPDGEWGVNCLECDGYSYPCNTIKVIIKEIA